MPWPAFALEFQPGVEKAAIGTTFRPRQFFLGVQFPTLGAVENSARPLGFVEVFVPPVIVVPEAHDDKESNRKAKEQKDFKIEDDQN